MEPILVYVIRENPSSDLPKLKFWNEKEVLSEPFSDRSEPFRAFFSSKEYEVLVPEIDTSSPRASSYEWVQIEHCLRHAQNDHPSRFVMILKDSSVCHAPLSTVSSVLKKVASTPNFHVCYLCKWMDRCQLYTDFHPIPGTMSSIAKTQSPQGIQGLLLSPAGRDVLLGSAPMKNGQTFRLSSSSPSSLSTVLQREIYAGNLEAICVVPNLVEYDLRLATEDRDYLKANPCLPIEPLPLDFGTSNPYVLGLIGLVLLILIVGAALAAAPPKF